METDQCLNEHLTDNCLLPKRFIAWFEQKGWQPRAHQIELLKRSKAGQSTLLIAPTGAGKTLAGFLPTLVDLEQKPKMDGYTRYIFRLSKRLLKIYKET